jgi:molybdate transport system substrate-binding protein
VTRGKTKLCPASTLCAFLPGVLLISASLYAQKQQAVRIAAASDLQFAMEELAAQFESRTNIRVAITGGSSGNFFAQIQSGAPFDLFFSADMQYPKRLEAAGLVEPGTLYEYAQGQILIWTPRDSAVDATKQGWSALLDSRIQKIAIANPALAPYGRAAVAALQGAGIYEQVKAKLVFGENISQAAQFVQSGSAQAGIIARSLALSPGMKDGNAWEIPANLHPPIEQGAVVLKSAKGKGAALEFLNFAKSETGRAILEKHGFTVPVKPD